MRYKRNSLKVNSDTANDDRTVHYLASSCLFSETYCGGYSGEDPPLPIPNREVKLTIADGTAPPGGRVGSCHFFIRAPDVYDIGGFSYVKAAAVVRPPVGLVMVQKTVGKPA